MKFKGLLRKRCGVYKHIAIIRKLKKVIIKMLCATEQMLKQCENSEIQQIIINGNVVYLNNEYTLKNGPRYTISYDDGLKENNLAEAKKRELRKILKFGEFLEKNYNVYWTNIEININTNDITIYANSLYGVERLNEHLRYAFYNVNIKVSV